MLGFFNIHIHQKSFYAGYETVLFLILLVFYDYQYIFHLVFGHVCSNQKVTLGQK